VNFVFSCKRKPCFKKRKNMRNRKWWRKERERKEGHEGEGDERIQEK
jgi:hypothetical protein